MKTIRVLITFDTEDGAFDNATVDAYTIHNALCRAFPLCRSSEIKVEDLPAYPPVQPCPICGCEGKHVGKRGSLALDAECTSCGWGYTTTARKSVLAALTR